MPQTLNPILIEMRKQILSLLLVMSLAPAALVHAQGFFVGGELVSNYIFRGRRFGGISVQPEFGYTYRGFTVKAWASSDFHLDENEIDLYAEYQYKGFKITFQDVFFQPQGKQFRYFDYRGKDIPHDYEAGVHYRISERVPLQLSWYTKVAGQDYTVNHSPENREFTGQRMFSSYFELSYPFTFRGIDCKPEIGFTPWRGTYADKFAVNNIAMQVSKSINITGTFSIRLFGKLIANPFDNRMFFVGGLGL